MKLGGERIDSRRFLRSDDDLPATLTGKASLSKKQSLLIDEQPLPALREEMPVPA